MRKILIYIMIRPQSSSSGRYSTTIITYFLNIILIVSSSIYPSFFFFFIIFFTCLMNRLERVTSFCMTVNLVFLYLNIPVSFIYT